MTIKTPSKMKTRKLNSTTPKTPAMDRSISVQGIISAQDQVTYDQVFKTRNRVIDDRQTPPPKNFKDSPMVVKELFTVPQPKFESPTKSSRSQKNKSFQSNDSRRDSIGESGDLKDMLKSSSEIFMLPEVEIKYLEQYSLDTAKLRELEQRLEQIVKRTKEITKFINYQIVKEEILMKPTIIKIQAWWRGVRERRRLREKGMLPNFNRTRYYPDLELAHKSATVIQARWFCVKKMISALRKQIQQQSESIVNPLDPRIEDLKKQVSAQDAEILALKETVKSQAEIISDIQNRLGKLDTSDSTGQTLES